ncbi:hypothetical protein ACVBEJ_01920 [Porticoccus sp. GXU_MW_L64]
MKTVKFIKYTAIVLVFSALIIWLGVKDAFNPIQRSEINSPIFTIGDLSYQKALSEGKGVVKFGPLFWGLYPGGIAFSNPGEAQDFILGNQELLDSFSSGWAIYELSGDMSLDTYRDGENRYINKSLLVIRPGFIDAKEFTR